MLIRLKNRLIKIKLLRSLKLRIFIIILLAGTIPSVFMRYAIMENYIDRAIEVKTSDVRNQVKIIANHLLTYNYLQDPSSEIINAELNQLSDLYDGRVLIMDQNFNVIKDTYGISEGKTVISEEVIKCFKGVNTVNYVEKYLYIEMTVPIVNSAATYFNNSDDSIGGKSLSKTVQGVMLISVSADSIATTLNILNRKALIVEFTMLILIVGIAVGLSNVLIRPFNHITQAIQEVKAGFTEEEISVPDYLETEHIVDAFNKLLLRMKVLDDSRQEFVSNVSHELKTPITSMKVLADSLLMQDEVPNELYKEFMIDIADEIDRESKIINDLLSLVKLDKTSADLNIESVDINSLLELILKRLRPIAKKRDIELVFESIRKITAEIDEVKLTLALSNLVENAVKYNKEHGWVKVVLNADHQFFTVEVSDSGIGIPEESMEQVFERFYRVDKSHSREIGGTGLGLAITRNAVLMHRGSVKIDSVLDEGTTFTVKIPLIYIS
ncbi:MAG TPA: ATP-binding protein [Lachnospiraceae bacterium]|nr:ATP-binding protein [Lachnospiraceae bacterium]